MNGRRVIVGLLGAAVLTMGMTTAAMAAPGGNGNGGGNGKPDNPPGKPDNPGKPDVPGQGKGGLYGDLRIVLRDVSGAPLLDDLQCELPISHDEALGGFGVEPVLNPVDGSMDNYPIPLVGVAGLEDHTECDVATTPIDFSVFVEEVDFGRLNLGRSPEKVLARQLDDVTATLTDVPILLDPAGRLVADGNTIDSPGQNLAIHQELQERGYLLDAYGVQVPLPTPDVAGYGVLDHAAAAIGASADKAGQVTPDLLVYNNRILDTPYETWLPTIDGDGVVGVLGERYVDYSGYSYDRAATYPGCVAGVRLDGFVEYHETIMSEVFGNEPFQASDIYGLTQRADDARAVIEYVHDTTDHVVTAVDLVGETGVCPG